LFNNNNNSILTGLTGLADRTRRRIEWLMSGRKGGGAKRPGTHNPYL
jgi:hypothetical protein